MDIGDLIAAKMAEKGWSQCLLAERSGVAQPQISRLVNKRAGNVELATLRALARSLGCSTIDLLPESDHKRQRAA